VRVTPTRALDHHVHRAVGARANLVLLDLDRDWLVREDAFRSRSSNSWLLGETLTGEVALTMVSGATAYAR